MRIVDIVGTVAAGVSDAVFAAGLEVEPVRIMDAGLNFKLPRHPLSVPAWEDAAACIIYMQPGWRGLTMLGNIEAELYMRERRPMLAEGFFHQTKGVEWCNNPPFSA